MRQRLTFVYFVFPVGLPSGGELCVQVDGATPDVRAWRVAGGDIVLERGGETVRVPAAHVERWRGADGVADGRTHAASPDVRLEREGELVVLYRPVGDHELALIEASGSRRFPPRLPEQPIFYPVTNARYARDIAEQWNVPEGHGAHVLRFRLPRTLVQRWLPVRCVGAPHHTELWVPAEELGSFNDGIVGRIDALPT